MAESPSVSKPNKFKILKPLGRGGFGSVSLVLHDKHNIVAYKECIGSTNDRSLLSDLKKEAATHRNLRHPNIVILYDAVFSSSACGLFLEYMKYGTVEEFLEKFHVSSDLKIHLIFEVAAGMCYLHQQKPAIIHGDLSCQNILIGEGFHAKIADFGLARILKDFYTNNITTTKLRGKTCYIAPEYFSNPCKRKSEKFDVYSFAISAWEMMSRKKAYSDFCDRKLIIGCVENGKRPDMGDVDQSTPPDLKELIERCWDGDENKRPSFDVIKKRLCQHMSQVVTGLENSYASLIEQEQNREGTFDNDIDPILKDETEARGSGSTGTTVSNRVKNNSTVESTKSSTAQPGSSINEESALQKFPPVLTKNKAKSAPINLTKNLACKTETPGKTIPSLTQSGSLPSQSQTRQLSSNVPGNATETQTRSETNTVREKRRLFEERSNAKDTSGEVLKPARRSMQIKHPELNGGIIVPSQNGTKMAEIRQQGLKKGVHDKAVSRNIVGIPEIQHPLGTSPPGTGGSTSPSVSKPFSDKEHICETSEVGCPAPPKSEPEAPKSVTKEKPIIMPKNKDYSCAISKRDEGNNVSSNPGINDKRLETKFKTGALRNVRMTAQHPLPSDSSTYNIVVNNVYLINQQLPASLHKLEDCQLSPTAARTFFDRQRFFSELSDKESSKPPLNYFTNPTKIDADVQEAIVSPQFVSKSIETARGQNINNACQDTTFQRPRFRGKLCPRREYFVQGMASLKNELYIAYVNSPDIDVYTTDSFAYQQTLTLERLRNPYDIAAFGNILYVSDDKFIHRIQLPEVVQSNWDLNSKNLKLSINKSGNVVVSSWEHGIIIVFSSIGNFLRQINLNFDVGKAFLEHAIQLDDDRFLICYHERHLSRVCIIDSYGRWLKSFDGDKGPGIGQPFLPLYIAADQDGSILVADTNNNRILQLNSSLEFHCEFLSASDGLKEPKRIHIHANGSGCLYISEAHQETIAVYDL